MKRYTTEQIKEYLNGCMLIDGEGKDVGDYNVSLRLAISLLNNYEDGIEAILERRAEQRKAKRRNDCFTYKGHKFMVRKAIVNRDKEYPWEFIHGKIGKSKFLNNPDSYATKKNCIEAAKEQIDWEVKCATKLTNKKKKIPKK